MIINKVIRANVVSVMELMELVINVRKDSS